jgi:hypothetical protein
MKGRAIAQAVSRLFPEFAVDKVTMEQIFFEYFDFPGFQSQSFYRLLHTRLSSGAGTLGKIAANAQRGFSLTPQQETKINN